jgi:hypothetical protein
MYYVMTAPNLKAFLRKKYPGVNSDERLVVRSQGCWNCTHFSKEKAKDLWWNEARAAQLNRAVKLALESPLGENSMPVKNIRAMIPVIDKAIEEGRFGRCSVGKQPDGTPVADFIEQGYMCQMWTGAEGASVAREGATLPEKLPEEVMERLMEKKVE